MWKSKTCEPAVIHAMVKNLKGAFLQIQQHLDSLLDYVQQNPRGTSTKVRVPATAGARGPLTPEEKARRRALDLCFYCGDPLHQISACPLRPPKPGTKCFHTPVPVKPVCTEPAPVKTTRLVVKTVPTKPKIATPATKPTKSSMGKLVPALQKKTSSPIKQAPKERPLSQPTPRRSRVNKPPAPKRVPAPREPESKATRLSAPRNLVTQEASSEESDQETPMQSAEPESDPEMPMEQESMDAEPAMPMEIEPGLHLMAGVARDPESSPLPPCCLYASPCPSDDSESEEEAADAGLDLLRQTARRTQGPPGQHKGYVGVARSVYCPAGMTHRTTVPCYHMGTDYRTPATKTISSAPCPRSAFIGALFMSPTVVRLPAKPKPQELETHPYVVELEVERKPEVAALQRAGSQDVAALQRAGSQDVAALQRAGSQDVAALQRAGSQDVAALQRAGSQDIAALQPAGVQEPCCTEVQVQEPCCTEVQEPCCTEVQEPCCTEVQEPCCTEVEVQEPCCTEVEVQEPCCTEVEVQEPCCTEVEVQEPCCTEVQFQEPCCTEVQVQEPCCTEVQVQEPCCTEVQVQEPCCTEVQVQEPCCTEVQVQEPCCTEVQVQEPCCTEVQAQTAATKTAFVDTDTAAATLPIPGKASPSSTVLVLVSTMAAQVNTLTQTIQDIQLNHKFLQSQVQVALARGHFPTPDLVATSNPIHLNEPAESSELSPPRGRQRRRKAKVAAAEPCSAMEVAAAEPCSAKEVAKVAAPPVFFKGAAPPVAEGAAPPHLVKGAAPPCHAKGAAPLYPAVTVETPISTTHCCQFPALAVPRRVWGFSKVDSPIPHSRKFGLYSGQPSQDTAHLGTTDATPDSAIRMDPYTVQGFMMDSSTARWLTFGRPEVDS
uniref:Uncharacterized protein n=1 Tax=Leptobrachium leishanense TaxID=445787 RepID=A0A8C5R358_9ANUR